MCNLKRITTVSFIVAVLGVFAFASTPVWAEAADCTKMKNGNDEKDALKRCEEKLNDSQAGMLNKLNQLIDVMDETEGVNLSAMAFTDPRTGEASDLKEHMAKMNRQHTRAKDAIAESVNEDFEEIVAGGGKQKGQNCKWEEDPEVVLNPEDFVPIGLKYIANTGLGNGLCDRFEARDPGKPNNVQIRERSQPNICVQVCKDKELPNQDPDPSLLAGPDDKVLKKDKIRGRHTERRSEGIDSTTRSEDALDAALLQLTKTNAMVKAYGPVNAFAMTFPECTGDVDATAAVAFGAKLVLVPVLVATKITTRVIAGLKEAGVVFCQQDVAGFNASSACVPAIVAHQISEGAVDIVEFLIQAVDLAKDGGDLFAADKTLECAASIRSRQEEMFALVTGIDGKVNALKTQVGEMSDGLTQMIEENREYIKNTRDIVLTPHGQRARVDLYEPDEQ
jgi:hypothetical protein